MRMMNSEMGFQQSDFQNSLLFCLLLQKIISAIGMDPACNDLKFHSDGPDDEFLIYVFHICVSLDQVIGLKG